MRGKAVDNLPLSSPARITPACAGKRHPKQSLASANRDHPRVCGEKWLRRNCSACSAGSPPRVRGKGYTFGDGRNFGGITPACAGKRLPCRGARLRRGDHPRVCGEKMVALQHEKKQSGSPPRVRGKDPLNDQVAVCNGITPACAGKRTVPELCAYTHKDHPRVCGEKPRRRSLGRTWPGSPPRVRGKASLTNFQAVTVGITPACAGKSWEMPISPCRTRDHPRVCGEKYIKEVGQDGRPGSPPRVRGKAQHTVLPALHSGITPACAGKRRSSPSSRRPSRDHPRVCGEKPKPLKNVFSARGSPPRVRGKASAQ